MSLHELLRLERPLFLFDTETTGVDAYKDRIIELGFQEWGPGGLVREWRTLVNPGIPIPAEATAVHGITDAVVRGCKECGASRENHGLLAEAAHADPACDPCPGFRPWPTFGQIAANVAGGWRGCDFAGKNIRFDLRITAAEMFRHGIEWSYAGARVIDAERLEQIAQPRTLSALHEKYTGAPHEGAHGALSDCRASATVLAAQFRAFPVLPRSLDELHELQWPGWLDAEGKFRMGADGVPRFGQWGKHAGKPMTAADPGYWDWILSAEFPADVKAIAREAKMKRYPTKNGGRA